MGEPSVHDSEASAGVGTEPLRLSFALLVKGKVDEMAIGLSFVDLDVALRVLAQMEESSLMNFPLGDATDVNCWLSTIAAPINAGEARLDVTCGRCTDPAVAEMERLTRTEGGVADATDLVNRVFDYGSDLLRGDYIQNAIDRMLNEAAYNCPHSPSYQRDFPGLVYQNMPVAKTEAPSYGFLFVVIGVIAVVAASAVSPLSRGACRGGVTTAG